MEQKKEQVLFKDNVLVKMKYELNTIENRIYTFILYKFQKDGQLLSCTIKHSELKEFTKNKNEQTVKGMSKLLSKLCDKKIFIEQIKPNGKNKIWYESRLIASYSYDDEFGTFTIKALEEIYVLICRRFDEGNYTPINLLIFMSLKNTYAQRMYDLLRLWTNNKDVVTYDLEELVELLMLESKYTLYSDFKRRVIKPAIKELNTTGVFDIDFKEKKVNRKVVAINFIVKDLDKRKYFEKIKETPEKEVAVTKTINSKPKKVLDFCNYSQREYDYDTLEKQLLGWEE